MKNSKWKRLALWTCAAIMAGCAAPAAKPAAFSPPEIVIQAPPGVGRTDPDAQPVRRTAIGQDEEGKPVFSLSVDGFIGDFNALYREEKGVDYLTPADRWKRYDSEALGAVCYQFSENEQVWSLPTVTVCVSPDGTGIRQVVVKFDEHSRTESLYALYERLCACTLRAFLPELDRDAAAELAGEVNRLAYENVFAHEDGYGPEAVPRALFYQDGVGVYPYFAVGEWVHFCVIPVTEDVVRDYESKGVTVYALEDSCGVFGGGAAFCGLSKGKGFGTTVPGDCGKLPKRL